LIAVVDFRAARRRSSDHCELRAYLQQLVGQPFLLIRFSYGDEFTLHLGQPREYRSSKLSHLTKGSYVIGARASSWFLKAHRPPSVIIGTAQPMSKAAKHLKPLKPELLEASKLLRLGARIVCVDAITLGTGRRSAYGFGLSVLFEDETSLLILPSPTPRQRQRSSQIADWEVFTPYDRYCRVGPGLHWSYLPSRASNDGNA
jgi:hypothetical protein